MAASAYMLCQSRAEEKVKFLVAEGVAISKKNKFWRATISEATMKLVISPTLKAANWVLIRGHLYNDGPRHATYLKVEFTDNREPIKIRLPVSSKGTVLELVQLPKEWKSLYLQPLSTPGEFDLINWSIKPVGLLERVVRRIQRVFPLYRTLSYNVRRRMGLHVCILFTGLTKAYRVAGNYRDAVTPVKYDYWLEKYAYLNSNDRKKIKNKIKKWHDKPLFYVFFLKNSASTNEVDPSSLEGQIYKNYVITVIKNECQLKKAILCISDDPNIWIAILDSQTKIAEHALYWVANEIRQQPDAELVYADHDFIDSRGERFSPEFKPDWSPQLLRSTNYISRSAVYRGQLIKSNVEFITEEFLDNDNHKFLLDITNKLDSKAIRHIPAPLWSFFSPVKLPEKISSNNNPVYRHLKENKIHAEVHVTDRGHYRIKYDIPKPAPKISIIIPTRDAPNYIKNCINSILDFSTYKNFEIIVVDNKTENIVAKKYLENLKSQSKIKLHYFEKDFNYSKINNFAAEKAEGEILCLLNNDTKVITANWLEEMLGYLCQPKVGVVGAKLYYQDGRLQHAGDVIGVGGCADHLHGKLSPGSSGYCDRAILAQDISAVTGACLMTWRNLYLGLGGLDESHLPIAFNDVDFCLRVREAGYRVIFTPYAELYHYESVSRGVDSNPEQIKRALSEIRYMRKKWKRVLAHDPFYNPNLNYNKPDFSLGVCPRVNYPW